MNVNVTSAVDGWTVVDVNYSMDIKKDSDNPVSGKYISCTRNIVEVCTHSTSSNPGIGIKSVLVKSSSNGSARVSDYSPKPDGNSSSGSLTISYPWGVSYSFETGASCSHTTTAGGIGYSYVEKEYYKKNWLGNRTYIVKDDRFTGVVTAELWQDSTTTSNPSYFRSKLQYTVVSRNYLSGSFDYNNSTSHTISGY